MTGRHAPPRFAAVVLVAFVIFAADLFTPHGIDEWVFYLPLPLAAVWFRRAAHVLWIAAVCTGLIVLGLVFSPVGVTYEWALGNRVMALLALWLMTAASLAIVRREARLDELAEALRREVAEHVQTELTLRESEARWRLAMHGGGVGTRDADPATGREVWSETQFRLLGYDPPADGVATAAMWADRVHPDDRHRVEEAKARARRDRSLYHIEHRVCPGGAATPTWVEVFGRYTYGPAGEAVRFVAVCFDITARKDLERELLEATARQQRDIGQELHDGVGQELTGLGLIAQSLAQRLPPAAPERAVAQRLVAGLDRVHGHVRDVARGVMPVHLDAGGLAAALAEMATRLTAETGVAVRADCPPGVDLPDPATATQLFRVAQEAVSNALRHGRPSAVTVSLDADAAELRLGVADDGVGLGKASGGGGGLGLRIMRYRAGVLGGILTFESPPGGGTLVTLTMPRSRTHGQARPA